MHEGQIKSVVSAAIGGGTLSHAGRAWQSGQLCCPPGIITVVIVRSPTRMRDGRAAGARLRVPPIASHRIAAVVSAGSTQGQSVCCFKPAYILMRYPPARRPLPHHASSLSSHRRPHSKAGCRAKQTPVPPAGACALMSVSPATQDRQPTHHRHPARRHWLSRDLLDPA